MIKYFIVKNNYEKSLDFETKLNSVLKKEHFKLDEENPEVVFVIGGDGTFLKATTKYNHLINKILFVPFNSGGIGYFTNKNRINHIEDIIESIINKKHNFIEYDILEIKSNQETKYIINEMKVINLSSPIEISIYINNVLLEKFKGTGISVSTAAGSTGFNKSINGSIILSKNSGLYEFVELAPISSNRYRTLNSSVILTKKDVLTLEPKSNFYIFKDTIKEELDAQKITIQISDYKLKICTNCGTNNETKILRSIFVQDGMD